MATGFGIAPDANGSGTTPEDIQRITAAKYENAGILTGAAVTRRSDWAYDVTDGAVIIDVAPEMAVEVPVSAQTLTPPTLSGGAAAVHTVYVKQNFPGTDGNSLAFVGITAGTAPAGSVVLDRFQVPAGATATTAATSNWDRVYALVSGASLGRLGYHADIDPTPYTTQTLTRGGFRITVPTDRLVDVQLTGTISHSTSGGATPATDLVSSVVFKIYIDNELRKSWEMGYSRLWESKQFHTTEFVSAGSHDVHYTVARRFANPGLSAANSYWAIRGGGSEQWRGNTIAVIDRGVSK